MPANKLTKKILFLFVLPFFLFLAAPAKAVCPICVAAAGAGLGISRYLGIDDTITGIWIGGLTLSVAMWTAGWIAKKNINFFGKRILIYSGYYAIIVIPLYWKELIGHPFNELWGMDKLILGIVIGTFGFWAGIHYYYYLKKRNGNRAYFSFQKVAVPVLALLILSASFYFLTK